MEILVRMVMLVGRHSMERKAFMAMVKRYDLQCFDNLSEYSHVRSLLMDLFCLW